MSLLKSPIDIAKFLPHINNKVHGIAGRTFTTPAVKNFFPLYAIVVEKSGKVNTAFKVSFATFRTDVMVFLLFQCEDMTKRQGVYVSMPIERFNAREKNKWGFEVDDIGLYIDSTSADKERIYFATSFLDAAEVRSKFEKGRQTVIAEVAYV